MIYRLAILALVSSAIASCSNDPRCTPGASAACTCTNGALGAQSCDEDGRFATCVCAAPDAGGDAGNRDADVPESGDVDSGLADAGGRDATDADAAIADADAAQRDSEPPPHCRSPPEGFARIPAGISVMGSESSEASSQPNERPLHEVELTRSYWMMTTEVTQEEWSARMGDRPWFYPDCASCPVESIDWHRALDYANVLSMSCSFTPCYPFDERSRRDHVVDLACEGFRLPTEAEWEHAARAGSTGSFHTGTATSATMSPCDSHLDGIGWYTCNSGGVPHPVGQLVPNPWGLFDMHGNVQEWVTDGYVDYPSPAMRRVDPLGPPLTMLQDRVYRGGAALLFFVYCRSAFRLVADPNEGAPSLGFRLVRAVPAGQ